MDPGLTELMKSFVAGEKQRAKYPTNCFYNKEFLLKMHEEALESHDNLILANQYHLQNTTTPTLHTSTNVKLIAANQINISQVIKSVDKVLKGKFLLCRTIAPPFKMTALGTVVDEPAGKLALRLSLYNYVPDVGFLPVAKSVELLPVGTILAIKNPWFKTTMDGGLSLRCDNPGDVSVLDEPALSKLGQPQLRWEGEIPSKYRKYMVQQERRQKKNSANGTAAATVTTDDSDYWKRIGNEHFVGKRYLEAIGAYNAGLKVDPSNIDLLANRAAAFLNVENFDLALLDADDVLNLNPSHVKGIFRKTKAMWGLQKYEQALEFLKKQAMPKLPTEKEIKSLMEKTEKFIEQSKYGKYPTKDIINNSNNNRATNNGAAAGAGTDSLEWADYTGDVIVKSTGSSRGRGLFATKPIAAGQLILANKAFGFVKKNEGQRDMLVSSNLETKLISDASQIQLVSSLAHSLRNNPEKGKILYQLYAGPELGYLDPDKPTAAGEDNECTLVDMRRIDAICSYNSFGHGKAFHFDTKNWKNSPSSAADAAAAAPSASARLCGLWILPSYINHSCIDCNSFWTIYHDFIFVRAFKNIGAGEEIVISYLNPADAYADRKKIFAKFGFLCRCSLCVYDRAEPESTRKEIEEIVQALEALETETSPDEDEKWYSQSSIPSVLPLLERLAKLRPKFQYFMTPAMDNLSGYYFKVGEFMKAYKVLEMTHQILVGTPMCASALQNCINLVSSLMKANRKRQAQQWVVVLKKLAMNAYGTLEVLECYPNTLRDMKNLKIHDD